MNRMRMIKLALSSLVDTSWRRLRGKPISDSWPFRFEWLWGVVRRNMLEDLGAPAREIRRSQEALAPDPQRDIARLETSLGGVDCEWFLGDAGADGEPAPGTPTLVYLHGGGYFFGSNDMYADLMGRLTHRANVPVLGVDYRLCPEHDLEDAAHDVVAVLEELDDRGWRSDDLVLGGDSAGGGVAVSASREIRDDGGSLPAALVLLSPWVDMRCDADSLYANSETDYMTGEMVEYAVEEIILEDRSPDDPYASPVCSDLAGLPPTLIHAGGAEIMRDDARLLADTLEGVGVDVTLEIWPEMVHVFHNFSAFLPRADEALDEVADYVEAALEREEAEPAAADPQGTVA